MAPVSRKAAWQRDPRPGALVVASGVAFSGFAALAVAMIFASAWDRLDVTLSAAIRAWSWPWLLPVARAITEVGNFWPMFVLSLVAVAWLYRRSHRVEALTLAILMSAGPLLGAGVKMLVARPRPVGVARIPLPPSYSFPSGHALASMLFFGSVAAIALMESQRLRKGVLVGVVCGLAIAAIGLSRVYLGVHYLGDVVGGWLLGGGCLALASVVSARWGGSPRS